MSGSEIPQSATLRRIDPDFSILQTAQTGDFSAFEELLRRYEQRVYRVAYRIVGQTEDAEDVVQQTFLAMIEHLEDFRGEALVSTWIFRIASNCALKLLRKRRGLPLQPLADDSESYSNVPHPDYIARWREPLQTPAEQAELRELLDRFIAELDSKYRVVFVLRDIEGLSTDETAVALGLTPANVKVRLLRARMALRERLTQVLGDETTRVIPDHQHHGNQVEEQTS